MKLRRERHRVPTSQELEQGGFVSRTDEPQEKRGLLRRFIRAGKLKVSDGVAERKHTPGISSGSAAQPGEPTPPRFLDIWRREETAQHVREKPKPSIARIPEKGQEQLRPRAIRIPDSVREQRGSGGPSRARP